MKHRSIDVIVFDKDGAELYSRDFETIREAREWVNECGRSRDWWARLAESNDFVRRVKTVRLMVNGECIDDWFPCWD